MAYSQNSAFVISLKRKGMRLGTAQTSTYIWPPYKHVNFKMFRGHDFLLSFKVLVVY